MRVNEEFSSRPSAHLAGVLALCLSAMAVNIAGAPLAPSAAVVRAAEDFSKVAAQANPWVVNIATTQILRQQIPQFWSEFFFQDFTRGGREYRRQSLGSGFILSSGGQILTNAHVVRGADEISVRLEDGEEYTAKVLGEDDSVDLAVLKIEPKTPLTPAVLGDSAGVKVGEWAIAIGNPFGFDHSVTVGVISAKERGNVFGDAGKNRYQNFFQTDASINHGNSGGPLCNIRGEVIGVNTAISTPNEGSIGIGFAIPINMVKRAVPDLVKSGRVITPRLGFYTQDIDARLSKALGLGSTKGVLVTDVAAGGAADKAGLKRGDVVVVVGGKPVGGSAEMKTRLFEAKLDEALTMTVLRKGKLVGIRIEPSQMSSADPEAWHGILVEENSPDKAAGLGLAIARGLLVRQVLKNSSADQIGLMPGDVIVEVNQQRVDGKAGWNKLTRSLEESADAILLLVRGNQSAYVVLPGEQ